MEYLYDKLIEYGHSAHYGFHMPGHKRNRSLMCAELPYHLDITEIEGFDDLHHAKGILKEAQERAAVLYGADETKYLINGSTVGLLSAVLGCTKRGDSVLMARNCHKSVYNAVIMNELRPIYVYPPECARMQLNGAIEAEQIECALTENPDVSAVIITSPTYDGVVSNIHEIAEVVHRRKIPLILDEAHGAHFGFHPYFPQNGNSQGADIVIHSLHKTLPSLTQTALIHINGNIVDREKIRWYLHALQSSSPSYVLMSSMDECIKMIEQNKESLFSCYTEMLEYVRKRLKSLENICLLETELYDKSKIVLSVNGSKLREEKYKFTGKRLYDILLQKYLLQLEMATDSYVIAMTSPADTEIGMERLVSAIKEIDGKLAKNKADELINSTQRFCVNEQIYVPSESHSSACRISVPLSECAGKIALEYAYIYPPGIPLIVPGEKISKPTAQRLSEYLSAGFEIQGTRIRGSIEVRKDG